MYKITLVTLILLVFSICCRSANIQNAEEKPGGGEEGAGGGSMSRDMSSAVSYQDDMPDMVAIMMQCNDTFRTDMSYLISLNESGNFVDETEKTPKCFIRCLLERTGVSPEGGREGRYSPARAAAVFAGSRGGRPMLDLEDMAASCAADREETCKCERAYAFFKCLMQMEIEKYEMNERS